MKKIDKLVQRVEYFERLAVYGDRSTFLKRLAQEASYQPYQGSTMVGDSGESTVIPSQTTKELTIVANPPIDPKIQNMLSDLLVPHGDIFILKPDGEMGPKTKDALEKFTKRFGRPATPAAIAQVYNEQKNQAVAKKDPGAPLGPMGPGLSGVVTNTKSTANQSAGKETDFSPTKPRT